MKDLAGILANDRRDTLLQSIFQVLTHNLKHYTAYDLTYTKENHYDFGIELNEGIVASFAGPLTRNNRPSTLFNLSGKGCYYYSLNRDYLVEWYHLFKYCLYHDFKFNRLDISFDLIGDEEVDKFVKWLIKKIKGGFARTPFKKYNYDREYFSTNGGYTLYLGSPSSDTRFRLYNKNAEKQSKDSRGFVDEGNFWRLELSLTNKKKDMISNFIINFCYYYEKDNDNLLNYMMSFLNSFLEIRIKDNERFSRCSIDPKWESFIGELKNTKFEIGDVDRRTSFEIKADWFDSSATRILSYIYLMYDEDLFKKWLISSIIMNIEKYKDEDFHILENHVLKEGIYNEFITDGLIDRIKLNDKIKELKKMIS